MAKKAIKASIKHKKTDNFGIIRLIYRWWTLPDSNRRPPRCERGALPTELKAQRGIIIVIRFAITRKEKRVGNLGKMGNMKKRKRKRGV